MGCWHCSGLDPVRGDVTDLVDDGLRVTPTAFWLTGEGVHADLLILGLGPEMRPLSPATRRYLSSLGLRVEVLDTRNAASQFNMLATERGVDDVAAALIPIGWREGIGANWG